MKRIQFVGTIGALIQMRAALLVLSLGLVQAQLHIIGQWETRPERMSVNPIHVGLLRTGKVLVIAESGNVPNVTVTKRVYGTRKPGPLQTRTFPGISSARACPFLQMVERLL